MKLGNRLGFAALALSLAPAIAFADEAALGIDQQSYTATLLDRTRATRGAKDVPLTIRLDRLSDDNVAAEISAFAEAGQIAALLETLSHSYVGRLEVNGRAGIPIAYARKFSDATGEHLVLIAQRAISLHDFQRVWPTYQYPLSVLQIDLDGDGHGTGEMAVAARIRLGDNGELELDRLELAPSRLVAVRRLDA